MGLLDKAKAAAERRRRRRRRASKTSSSKRELSQAYNELGKIAFELLESNDISHPKLDTVAAKIRTLNERDKGDGARRHGGYGGHPRSEPAAAMPT